MSKIKEQLLHDQDTKMKYHGEFMDFIYDNLVNTKLSDDDINKLEEDQLRPSSVSKQIISTQASNNTENNNKRRIA